jgi:hypothetical protein
MMNKRERARVCVKRQRAWTVEGENEKIKKSKKDDRQQSDWAGKVRAGKVKSMMKSPTLSHSSTHAQTDRGQPTDPPQQQQQQQQQQHTKTRAKKTTLSSRALVDDDDDDCDDDALK